MIKEYNLNKTNSLSNEELLKRYEAVNDCESLKELADVIRSFANDEGLIDGRISIFNAEKMANVCENYSLYFHNNLTRNYGIRQQAMMLLYYAKEEIK